MSLFYTINPKGTIAISNYRLGKYVQSLGFAKYYYSNEKTITPIYIYKKEQNIIEPVSPIRVHETVIRELESRAGSPDSIPISDLPRVVDKLVGSKILTSPELLITMDKLDRWIISDTSDMGIFPYGNGVATVTREGIQFNPSSSIDGYIWSSQIIPRNLKLIPKEESGRSDFFRFLRNITSIGTMNGWTENQDRFDVLYSLIGYLLHSYKDPTNARAVILMDSSLNGNPTGRTGKGLTVIALFYIRKGVRIDGKGYEDSGRFNNSCVTPDTKLLFIDDVAMKYDFEKLFSVITEGIKVEEKFQPSYYIPYHNSPKIIISTNYSLVGRGSSHNARKYEFALSNYYSDTFSPMDEFGRRFFDEWDATQWNYFDNLMLYAVQSYLQNGVSVASDPKIEEKKLLTETSPEFVEWVLDQHLELGQRFESSEIYGRYIRQTDSTIDRKSFIGYLRSYANSNGWVLDQPHSGNVRYVEFKLR